MKRKRLFIVSNRLPICISGAREETTVSPDSSDFIDSVNKYINKDSYAFGRPFWTGIPGCTPSTWNEATNHLDESRFTYIPVLVYKDQYDRYYNGFSNSVLWPLFYSSSLDTVYNEDDYQHYVQVNEHFAEILSRHCRKDDTVWIDGYHLLLLPAMLRRQIPGLTIGAFFQFPFPSFKKFSKISETLQYAILNGITGASFIGFRNDSDTANFLECISQKLDVSVREHVVLIRERPVQVLSLPVNSDFNKLEVAAGLSSSNAEVI